LEALKIRAEGLTKRFRSRSGRRVTALQNLSFALPQGICLAVVGPRGSGRTTLLRILAGLEREDGGTLTIHHATPARPLVSMVFPCRDIFPWYTVAENISYGLRLQRWAPEHRQDAAAHYARALGLGAVLHAHPGNLPAGLQQRISVARALASDSEILLLDEPLTAQDTRGAELIRRELARARRHGRQTIVYAASSPDEARLVGDEVLTLV
jgi:NitT/TauT family transport system ATP-binding protein